ncbi:MULTISPECIES: folate-binding protein YgfZ [unclassified Rhizobium]|uniref:CAF17-like 4Fe-4S cluster assembly/insertion protein YgfZ n=1 Tax=unclassified Rhizobium TaxID=2613769 RepID=UPI0006F3440B|nr:MULTISPECIES: folate-binding protein YgfZ [unclassified Rhizobium]KQV43435.1 aminomethyltransferase [Rhizobium sp. Root1212]KRD37621.1 aminomethyltransferase [Rhizobium sp. Root268]
MQPIALPDRALISISGKDAEALLQNLITTDLDQLQAGEARPGALLTPQGKILFDFVVSRDGDGLRLETGTEQAEALLKRLTMYKLRADVALSLQSPASVWISDEGGYRDTRFEKAGAPLHRHYDVAPAGAGEATGYEDLRIASGIAVAGADYPLQDAFPHDVLLDLNGGLSFKKGCYVGQEVVSRMQHRGTARRRVVLVAGDEALPESGTPITVNDRPIGTLGSVSGRNGLAIVRIDKAGEAIADGKPILCGGTAVTLTLPGWSGLSFPSTADEASA